MHHIEGQDRNQLTLFPEALNGYISADNPVRFLDAFVETLDIKALGFKNATLRDTGRPPFELSAATGVRFSELLTRTKK